MKLSMNEMAALMLVLDNISVKELLTACVHGFDEKTDIKSKDSSNLYTHAIESYLRQV